MDQIHLSPLFLMDKSLFWKFLCYIENRYENCYKNLIAIQELFDGSILIFWKEKFCSLSLIRKKPFAPLGTIDHDSSGPTDPN